MRQSYITHNYKLCGINSVERCIRKSFNHEMMKYGNIREDVHDPPKFARHLDANDPQYVVLVVY